MEALALKTPSPVTAAKTYDAVCPPRARRKVGWYVAWFWTGFIGLGGTVAAVLGHKVGVPLAFAVAVLAIMSLPYMACAYTGFVREMRSWFSRVGSRGLLLVTAGFVAAYLVYALGTGVFGWLAIGRVLTFIGAPSILAWSAGRQGKVAWQDWAAIACIWLPFNFGLLNSIWEWPEGQAGYIMNTPMAMDLALVTFLGYRRFNFVAFRFRVRRQDLPLVAMSLAGFMLIALPIGLGTGFLSINPKLEFIKIVGSPLAIFFFIAVPEEFLFRGLVQGMLLAQTKKPWVAIGVASLLFGVSHWHNPGMPDFRYLGLAAIAGVFYGYTYYRSGSIAVSALLHASVDTLWDLFFHAGP